MNIVDILIIIPGFILFLLLLSFKPLLRMITRRIYQLIDIKQESKQYQQNFDYDYPAPSQKDQYNYSYSYRKKPMLTNNEKKEYWKIKSITDELGLILFSKVRLFDLLEPIPGTYKFKGAQWKIQAKHVDFVICDKNLNALAILEIDDSSHEKIDRQIRDEFVDTILMNNGYDTIHVREINEENRQSIKDFIQEKVKG